MENEINSNQQEIAQNDVQNSDVKNVEPIIEQTAELPKNQPDTPSNEQTIEQVAEEKTLPQTNNQQKNDSEEELSPEDKMRLQELKLLRKLEKERAKNGFSGILTKIILILLMIAVLGIVGIIGFKVVNSQKNDKSSVSTVSVLLDATFKSCQELSTYKYNYTRMDFIKLVSNNKLKSYVLYEYSGMITAGIKELDDCKIVVSDDRKNIEIDIPKIEILSNSLLDSKVLDEFPSDGKRRAVSNSELMENIHTNMIDYQNDSIRGGLLEKAREHAKTIIENVFYAAGFESVVVNIPEPDPLDSLIDIAIEVAQPH